MANVACEGKSGQEICRLSLILVGFSAILLFGRLDESKSTCRRFCFVCLFLSWVRRAVVVVTFSGRYLNCGFAGDAILWLLWRHTAHTLTDSNGHTSLSSGYTALLCCIRMKWRSLEYCSVFTSFSLLRSAAAAAAVSAACACSRSDHRTAIATQQDTQTARPMKIIADASDHGGWCARTQLSAQCRLRCQAAA